jgi:hypothetical protein
MKYREEKIGKKKRWHVFRSLFISISMGCSASVDLRTYPNHMIWIIPANGRKLEPLATAKGFLIADITQSY